VTRPDPAEKDTDYRGLSNNISFKRTYQAFKIDEYDHKQIF